MEPLVSNLIKIGNRAVGTGFPAFIVAEIGINHNGDMDLAKKMIDAAVEAGVDSVKFQNYITEDFLSVDTSLTYEYENNGQKIVESQFDMFKRCQLSPENVHQLKEYCDRSGIIFHSTPTSKEGVDLLVREGVQVLKNGSDFLTNSSLLKHMARTDLPVVIATGMASEDEIAEAVKTIRQTGNEKLIVLHCTSSYPTKPEHVNLRKMTSISTEFDCLAGFSDHSEGFEAAVGAVALGACWIEKHFTLDKNLPGPDHRFSSNQAEMAELVKSVRRMELLLGSGELGPAESELLGREQYRLSCASARALSEGHILQEDDIVFRRPATGLPPSSIDLILGKPLARSVDPFETLRLSDFRDLK